MITGNGGAAMKRILLWGLGLLAIGLAVGFLARLLWPQSNHRA